jgi:hypothetical protein
MAIDRPGMIGDVSGEDRSEAEDAKAKTLLFREEWDRWGGPVRGGETRGRKSRATALRPRRSRRSRSPARSSPREARGPRAIKGILSENRVSVGFQDPDRRSPGRITTLYAPQPMGISPYYETAPSCPTTIPSRDSSGRAPGHPAGEGHYVGATAGLGLDDRLTQPESPNPTCSPFSGDDGAPASMPRARGRPVE